MTPPDRKLRVFIGSSSEHSDLAASLQTLLTINSQNRVSATHWDDVFPYGRTTIESLEAALPGFDFAAFIVAPDDVVISREKEFATVRDNVLLEAGMFIAQLGRERVFLIYPNDFSVKMPSDWQGISVPTWSVLSRERPKEALRNTAFELIKSIVSKGPHVPVSKDADEPPQFFTRDDADRFVRPFRERIAAARKELIITGNDCLTVVQGGSASIRAALANGVRVKVMCADPAAAGLVEMLTMIDPRFPRRRDFEQSIEALQDLVGEFRESFGDLFEFRLLPVVPAMGFFLVDPDEGGPIKFEIYTPKDWKPIDSRPHFVTEQDPRWRDYFIQMFRNYWALSRIPEKLKTPADGSVRRLTERGSAWRHRK